VARAHRPVVHARSKRTASFPRRAKQSCPVAGSPSPWPWGAWATTAWTARCATLNPKPDPEPCGPLARLLRAKRYRPVAWGMWPWGVWAKARPGSVRKGSGTARAARVSLSVRQGTKRRARARVLAMRQGTKRRRMRGCLRCGEGRSAARLRGRLHNRRGNNALGRCQAESAFWGVCHI
jgi:hypothetical protein